MKRDGTTPLPAGMTPRLLSRDEAAAYCGISPGTFDEYVGVPPIRFGSRRLWDRVALDWWLDRASGLASDPQKKPVGALADRLD
jgi:hypothetical protein